MSIITYRANDAFDLADALVVVEAATPAPRTIADEVPRSGRHGGGTALQE